MAQGPQKPNTPQTQQHGLYLEARVHLDNLQKDNLAKQILGLCRSGRLRNGIVRRIPITPRSQLVIVVYQCGGIVHLVAGYFRRKGEPNPQQRRAIRAALGRIRGAV